MLETVVLLGAFASLSTGCRTVVPSPTEAHRLAQPAKLKVYVRLPDGSLAEERVQFQPGDYCATAQAINAVK